MITDHDAKKQPASTTHPLDENSLVVIQMQVYMLLSQGCFAYKATSNSLQRVYLGMQCCGTCVLHGMTHAALLIFHAGSSPSTCTRPAITCDM